MSATKVKFKESISCMDGSFAAGQVVLLDDRLAGPWLKSGQVVRDSADPVTPVVESVATVPFVPKDLPPQFKQPELPKPVFKPGKAKSGK